MDQNSIASALSDLEPDEANVYSSANNTVTEVHQPGSAGEHTGGCTGLVSDSTNNTVTEVHLVVLRSCFVEVVEAMVEV